MPPPRKPAASQTSSKQEKLSILATILGPDAMAKLDAGQGGAKSAREGASPELDPERVKWHRNRLLARFRAKNASEQSAVGPVQVPPDQEGAAPLRGKKQGKLDDRVVALSDPTSLAQEHPAVIARIVSGLQRAERVKALRALPGPLARSVIKRIR